MHSHATVVDISPALCDLGSHLCAPSVCAGMCVCVCLYTCVCVCITTWVPVLEEQRDHNETRIAHLPHSVTSTAFILPVETTTEDQEGSLSGV